MKNKDNLINYGNKIKLDEKDKQILKAINHDARQTIAQISKKTGIQRDSVLYRIKKMQKQKLIRFYHTVLNPSILGYPIYTFVNITLHNITQNDEQTLITYLKKQPNITYVAKTTGKWDLTINICAQNLNEFDKIMTEIRMKFSKIIKDYETASIIQEHKYDSMTELVNIEK